MRALLYHDVAPREEWHTTGFEGGDAAVYKFGADDLRSAPRSTGPDWPRAGAHNSTRRPIHGC